MSPGICRCSTPRCARRSRSAAATSIPACTCGVRPRRRCGIRSAPDPAATCPAWIPGHCRFRPSPWWPTRTTAGSAWLRRSPGRCRPSRRTQAWTRRACAPPPAPPCGNGPGSAVEVPPDRLRDTLLGDLAVVGGHGEGVRDYENAEAPGEGGPDAAADRLFCEQVADRIDDGCHGLVIGEGAYRAGHGTGGHECRADERQEDEREGSRAVRGLRG